MTPGSCTGDVVQEPAVQAWNPEFKPQSHQKKKKTEELVK
jgi:hypothetical protein